jgi:hypothetical protein
MKLLIVFAFVISAASASPQFNQKGRAQFNAGAGLLKPGSNFRASQQFNQGRAAPTGVNFQSSGQLNQDGSVDASINAGFGSGDDSGIDSPAQQGRATPTEASANANSGFQGAQQQFQPSKSQQQGRSNFGASNISPQAGDPSASTDVDPSQFPEGRSLGGGFNNFGSSQFNRGQSNQVGGNAGASRFNTGFNAQGKSQSSGQFNKGQAGGSTGAGFNSQQGKFKPSGQFNKGFNTSPSQQGRTPAQGSNFGSSQGQFNQGQAGASGSNFKASSTKGGSNFEGQFGAGGSTGDIAILKSDLTKTANNYQWDYELSDGSKRYEEAELKEIEGRAGIAIRGEYSYIGPDGETYTVTYVADENGFRPEGRHLYSVLNKFD